MLAVVLSYFLPLCLSKKSFFLKHERLVGLGVSDWRSWKDGQFALLGERRVHS